MSNAQEYIVYGYSLGNPVFEIKPDIGQPNSTFVPNIIQVIPARTTPAIRIIENIQICNPAQQLQVACDVSPSCFVTQSDSIPSVSEQVTPNADSISTTSDAPVAIEIISSLVETKSDSTDHDPKTISHDKLNVDKKTRPKSKLKKPVAKSQQITKLKPPTPPPATVTTGKTILFKPRKDFLYECDICDSQFLSPVSLRLHKTGHRYGAPEEKKTYSCRFCGRQFSHLQTLGDHEKVHIDDPYDCGTCGARYSSKSGLRNHLSKNSKCNVAFQSAKLQKKKQDEEQKDHGCDICGKTYRHRKSMLEHRSLHFRNKQHRCDRCGVMFETTGGWRKHRANQRCEFSKRKFKDPGGGDELFIPEERKKFLEQVKQLEGESGAGFSAGRKTEQKRKSRERSRSNSSENSQFSNISNGHSENTSFEIEDESKASQDRKLEISPQPLIELVTIPDTSTGSKDINAIDEPEISLESIKQPEEIKYEITSDQETEKIDTKESLKDDEGNNDNKIRQEVDVDQSEDDLVIPLPAKKAVGRNDPKEPVPRKPRKPKEHKCPTCDKTFARGFILKNHLRKHTGERPFLCDSCPKSFGDAASLKMHSVIHTGEKPFPCSECPARFARKSGLRNHITIHFNLPCDECDQKFPSRKTLVRHKIKHQGVRPFLCEICSKDFRTKADMTAHMRIHSNEKRYVCKICSARFNCPSTLRRHRNVHAPPETRPVCESCGKSFSSRQALQKHENIHKNLKPFQCEICSKCFRVNDHLKVHLRSHYGEKPFSCDLCQKRFVTNGDLRVHYRRHTGEKPYTCDECGQGFVVTAGLYRHQNETGHENSKPTAIIVPEYTRAT
ncbi:zinc finger protein 665-like [Topomyia yanbarensis]|uniref:zinc finger protein 665-like n=1 Tax=Topomyia yanbarensis TaxID=2498891 RepID=UPI00273B0989|nr:zinc finger protein 665-like [Topomyia yanbarensis]